MTRTPTIVTRGEWTLAVWDSLVRVGCYQVSARKGSCVLKLDKVTPEDFNAMDFDKEWSRG